MENSLSIFFRIFYCNSAEAKKNIHGVNQYGRYHYKYTQSQKDTNYSVITVKFGVLGQVLRHRHYDNTAVKWSNVVWN